MIDLQTHTLVPLQEVPDILPRRRGRKLHISSVYRWAQRGVAGRRLEIVYIGGVAYTSVQALEEFMRRQGDTALDAQASRQRQREIDRAEREADQLGLG